MKNKAQDDILDDKEYLVIRTLSLSLLELFIVSFTLVSILIIFAPLTYKILVTSPTPPTGGDKFGLFLLVLVTILKLIPFVFVLLFSRISNNRYLDKTNIFKASYLIQLQQYSNYVAFFYVGFGVLMSFLYGFSDSRTFYTGSMFLTGLVILAYTRKTSVYV